MRGVFPGRPQAKLQAVDTALWMNQRIVVYISGSALIILRGPSEIVQTISRHEEEDLVAVAIDNTSGKVATTTATTTQIYQPVGQSRLDLRWSLQSQWTPSCHDTAISALSWGLPEELLIAGSSLTLLSTNKQCREQWTKNLANPAKLAAFSHDASLIATTGWHDRLLKLWRRVFSGEDGDKFDAAYLLHPATVTAFRWRDSSDMDPHLDTVLYTVCADQKLRVWNAKDPHGLQMLQQCAELDLIQCIQPRSPLSPSPFKTRNVVILDSCDFKALVEEACGKKGATEREKHTRDHLKDIVSRECEICIVTDDRGNLSAWGLERVACKARQPGVFNHIGHAEGLDLRFSRDTRPGYNHVQSYIFGGRGSNGSLHYLANYFDGRLEWLTSPVEQFFDPSNLNRQIVSEASLTGHTKTIESLSTSHDGSTIVSASSEYEAIVWSKSNSVSKSPLLINSEIYTTEAIVDTIAIHRGHFVIALHHDRFTVWDCRQMKALFVAQESHELISTPISLVLITDAISPSNDYQFAIVSSDMDHCYFDISCEEPFTAISIKQSSVLSTKSSSNQGNGFGATQDIYLIEPLLGGKIAACNKAGDIEIWKLPADTSGADWCPTSSTTIQTNIKDSSLLSVLDDRFLAVCNSSKNVLVIWNERDNLLEFTKKFEAYETIQALAWSTTPSNNAILAVALTHKILLVAQHVYHDLNSRAPWIVLKMIDVMQDTTVPLAAMTWIDNDTILCAAGSQMFGLETSLSRPESITPSIHEASNKQEHISDVVDQSNLALSFHHPHCLMQLVMSGQLSYAAYTLRCFDKILKFWSEGEEIDKFIGLDKDDLSLDITRSIHTDFKDDGDDDDNDAQSFDLESAASLIERLKQIEIPHFSQIEQARLIAVVSSIGSLDKQRRSIDVFGLKYLASLYLQDTHIPRTDFPAPNPSWRDITWAYHSTSQDILIDLTTKQYQGKLLWTDARKTGMFMWMNDLDALRAQFEVIARNEYTKTEEKNPVDCTLYYLALKKKQVLRGLWRMATWSKEQGATSKMLANNFEDPRWKSAATKNAYALMGRRRFEYAAAFFLLADQLRDAVDLLADQLEDLQLAIAVARVYEGDDGPVIKHLLSEKILPQAVRDGNKWLATWAFSMLGMSDKAVQALMTPLYKLVDHAELPTPRARSWKHEDPALIHLYTHLRDMWARKPNRSFYVSVKEEWDFVLRTARLYRRMGCEIIALDLVRNFHFLPADSFKRNHSQIPVGDVLDGNETQEQAPGVNEPIIDPAASSIVNGHARKKVTEEPSAASIFDSFDF